MTLASVCREGNSGGGGIEPVQTRRPRRSYSVYRACLGLGAWGVFYFVFPHSTSNVLLSLFVLRCCVLSVGQPDATRVTSPKLKACCWPRRVQSAGWLAAARQGYAKTKQRPDHRTMDEDRY